MQYFDDPAIADALPYDALIDALDAAFRSDARMPPRTHHVVDVPGRPDATLLLMPAWQPGQALGVKIATVFADNAERGIASVNATYLLLDAESGMALAVLDGAELTLRRTAAASALASRYLSRTDSAALLMIGTGNLAPHLITAHASVRAIKRVMIWGRRPEAARAIADGLDLSGVNIECVADIGEAIPRADIISAATLSRDPLISGEHLKAGQHIDLVGAFTPEMREADDSALTRSDVYVDTFDGALAEAGEIVQALASGTLERTDIRADLGQLCRGERPGRKSADAITLFKSVGCSLEDLAAAQLVRDRLSSPASLP